MKNFRCLYINIERDVTTVVGETDDFRLTLAPV